jgi:hypothetical protein
MPLELLLERRPYGFRPLTPADEQEASVIPIGGVIKARMTRHKSGPMFRFYWKMIELVSQGIGIGKVPLSKELLIRTGYVHSFVMRHGQTQVEPMSLAEMDHDTFKEYFDASLQLLCAEYVAIPRNKLLREAGQMAGLTYEEAFARPTTGKKNGATRSQGLIPEE